jgi:hypothetical protein
MESMMVKLCYGKPLLFTPAPRTYLVDAIVAVSVLGCVLGVLASLAVPDDPHWLASLPVLRLPSLLVVQRAVTVLRQSSALK